MSLNFNVDPYYDDFDPTKNFHRILFKPGFAVQARELTQSQTILQDQITKFADNIFKQNSPVTGGQITTNLNCYYIKLQNTDSNGNQIDPTVFDGRLIQNATGTVVARVIKFAVSTLTSTGAGDPPTLIVTYKTGTQFVDGDTIYDSLSPNTTAQALTSDATGLSSVASIAQGVFYISGNYTRSDGIVISNGTFVQVNPQTVILSKYSNTPSVRVGLNITETIYDYVNDPSMLDPAVGASNYQAPGADRYVITLTLETRPLTLGDDDGFIQLIRIDAGNVYKLVDGSVYNVIDDYFAKRDFETNGDYIVKDFSLTPKTNADSTKYTMSVGRGLAYVHGYRIENPAPLDLVSNRARTTKSQTNTPVYIDIGSYFYVNTLSGANAHSFFDNGSGVYQAAQPIDIHCVSVANVNVSSSIAYSSTVVSSGNLRNIIYDHNSTDTQANTSVYKFYVNDMQNNVLSANVVSATSNTIVMPSSFSSVNSAYVGVTVSIIKGTSAGDPRTISAYDGSTRTATVSQAWSAIPDTTSVFNLNFGIKDSETIVYAGKSSYPATIYGTAIIDVSNKAGNILSGDVSMQNPTNPEMIFRIGNPYVSSLSTTTYTTTLVNHGVSFTPAGSGTAAAQLAYSSYSGDVVPLATGTLSSDTIKQNYTVIVTNKGTNTKINVGDVLVWTSSANASRSMSVTGSSPSQLVNFFTATTDLAPFTATVLSKAFVQNGDSTKILRTKSLVTGNTTYVKTTSVSGGTAANTNTFVDSVSGGQIYINKAGLVSPGSKQSLYVVDVKKVVAIYDTGAAGTVPTVGAAIPSYANITTNYTFNSGQKDSYYDHAYITLRPGRPQPSGNILVIVDYYVHSGGDGFFSVASYTNETYTQIPNYSAADGIIYPLRDSIDFRPSRVNASTTFSFRTNSGGVNQTLLPTDLTTFTGTYAYYLARKDKLILTKDKSLQIIEGTPSTTPNLPTEPEGSLVIANLVHNPYTGFLPTEAPAGISGDLSIDKVQHKRFTMQDISGLESRINQIEYYAALSTLEQNAQSLQTPDTLGLNRFKNGILVDDFSSFATADSYSPDFLVAINKRTRQMTAAQNVRNFPMKPLAVTYNMGKLDSVSQSNLGYKINQDGLINYITLPYTTGNLISQRTASRTVNLNPFSIPRAEGITAITPNMDNWVDNTQLPALLITDPNLTVSRESSTNSVLSQGDWKTVSGTSSSVSSSTSASKDIYVEGHNKNWSPYGYKGYHAIETDATTTTTTTTSTVQQQNSIIGPYSKIGNTYAINNGYITDVSVLPWIRQQQIIFRSKGLLFNTELSAFFDGISVDKYIRKANVIELTGVSGTFNEDDVVGYVNAGGNFIPTAIVLGVYNYADTTLVRLYVAGDGSSANYNGGSFKLVSGNFNSSGTYQSYAASGTIASTNHYAGVVKNTNTSATTSNTLTISALSANVTNYFGTSGNTLSIVSGTGVGQSATITAFDYTTDKITLSSPITCANGDIYSIDTQSTSTVIKSNEHGSAYGIFCLPTNVFHTGERIFRVDNSLGGDPTTATTFSQATFYASGLSTSSQALDFGASPSGAKKTFVSTREQTLVSSTTNVSVSKTVKILNKWDPVAQSFIIDDTNFPNGAFISSVNFFFKTKPAAASADRSPVSLSIVGTQNGYPNGVTLDHSAISVPWEKINISDTPHYLDPLSYTTFNFSVPIYVRPNVLYAFILSSSSNEYTAWVAATGDTAVSSSVKNLPSDTTPTAISKITAAPYVGGLFISQNAQTWNADQNQSLMFTIDRCIFSTASSPTVQFVVPKKLPERRIIDQTIDYYLDANSVTSQTNAVNNTDVLVDAFNVTTTDFVPTTTSISYTYNATLSDGSSAGSVNITPGKFGTSTYDDIYLSDGKRQRVLFANTNNSLSVYAQLTSVDPAVSPLISDAGLSAYAITWSINNCELSNSVITLSSGGSGYNALTTSVTVIGGASNGGNTSNIATAAANISGGVIQSIYLTNVNGGGSGYVTTPTLIIADSNTTPGSGATAYVTGETSKTGGPAIAKYVTKKVVLDAGYDSGDLNVYITAYRPVNTDILVYYKILNRNDTQKFDDGSWQLMNKIRSGESVYSQTRSDVIEYVFAPGTGGIDQGYVSYTSTNAQVYTTFSQFAIKIVLISSDHTYTPFLNDLRCLALPSTLNTPLVKNN
jgi:hypothetical protein